MVHKVRLEGLLEEIKTYERRYKEELKDLPDGYLNIRKKGSEEYYTWQIPVGGRRRKLFRKGITKNSELIRQLTRKRYLEEALTRIRGDVRALEAMFLKYKAFDEKSVMDEFVKAHPGLEKDVYYGDTNSDEWAADYRKPVNFFEEDLRSTSATGGKMRSKGEIIIASRLEFFKIPYRYEAPIPHPDVNRVPDFTIRRPRDGKIIYWEHWGLVNNRDYLQHNIRKLEEYGEIGVTPWSNLILTYDQEDGGIDVRIIDGLIQGWLR